MTFTYNLASEDEDILNISKVRMELGDIVVNVGTKPDGSNLTDEEIAVWLEAEEDHIMRAVARACEALSRMWTTVTNITVGPRKEELGKVASDWSNRAVSLRETYGGSTSTAFSIGLKRTDGYSEEAASS